MMLSTSRLLLLRDDPRNAKECPLALRSLGKDRFAIETGPRAIRSLDVTGLDDLRGRGDLRYIEFRKHVDMVEEIAKLRAETLHLVVG
jgi:hypothetical protein